MKNQIKLIQDWIYTYICEANIWTPETTPKWSIARSSNAGLMFPLWNDWAPTGEFSFLPGEAATLTYSYN